MRKIEFRGKGKDTGEWVYGYYVCLDDNSRTVHYILTGKSELFYGSGTCVETFQKYEVDPETVEQYLGTTDEGCGKIYVKIF